MPAPPAESGIPEVLTLDEAAQFLRLEPGMVAELARSHALPGRHAGGQWRFHRAALVDWLKGDAFMAAAALQDVRGAGAVAQGAPNPPGQAQPAGATTPQPVGEKPITRGAEETALRDQAVLLPAGRTTVEVGVSYGRAERRNFGLLLLEQNAAAANLAVRYGLRDDLQVSLRLPAIYRRLSTQVVPELGESSRTTDTYAGDLSSSLHAVVAREATGRPNVIVSADVVLPTGPGDLGLGGGIVVSKSFDPVVLFAGASYMRGLRVDDPDPRRVLARNNFGFNFGYAYAINDAVALTGAFTGTYKPSSHGVRTDGLAPSRENYQLQFGATLQLGRGLFLEPTISIGVGGSAPDFTLSLNVPYTF